MFLDYNLDIERRSAWKIAHPMQDFEPFPFVVSEIGIFYAKERYFTERKGKDDYLLLYTIAGAGELAYQDQVWALAPGSACLIDCNQPHSYRTAPGPEAEWAFYWVHVATPFGRQYYELLYAKGYSVQSAGMDTELLDCFRQALDLMEYALSATACQLSHCVSAMFTKLVSLRNPSALEIPLDETVQLALDYIKDHFEQPLDLDALTRKLGMSKYYFIKLFSRHIGVTPYRYLIMYRINRAKQLLRTTEYKVGEIGRAVGFADESNFTRTFARFVGAAPSRYRMIAGADVKSLGRA